MPAGRADSPTEPHRWMLSPSNPAWQKRGPTGPAGERASAL
jgi:hypothetical protein